MQANEENLKQLEALVSEWVRDSAMHQLAEEALTSWQLAKMDGC